MDFDSFEIGSGRADFSGIFDEIAADGPADTMLFGFVRFVATDHAEVSDIALTVEGDVYVSDEKTGVGTDDGWVGSSALEKTADFIRIALVPNTFVGALHELSEVETRFCFRSSEKRGREGGRAGCKGWACVDEGGDLVGSRWVGRSDMGARLL